MEPLCRYRGSPASTVWGNCVPPLVNGIFSVDFFQRFHCNYHIQKRKRDVIITLLLRQNNVVTSFWRNSDISITSRVRCVNVPSFHDSPCWGQLISPNAPFIRQWTGSTLVQVMVCRLSGAKPLPEPMLPCCRLGPHEQLSWNFESKYETFHSWKCTWKRRLRNDGHCALLRCSWSIACRRCPNYIFIFDLTPGFNRSHKDNCKTRRETFKF